MGNIKKQIDEIVMASGVIYLGAVSPTNRDDYARYERWITEGRHGGMRFMENHKEVRADPNLILPGVRTVLTFAWEYGLGDKFIPLGTAPSPRIAQYARLKDYHVYLRKKGEGIWQALSNLPPFQKQIGRIIVDSAPFLERAAAARSGTGFIGKNTCFIHRERGSFLLLFEILTTAEVATTDVDPAQHRERADRGGCGTCRRCQVHCPTGALDQDYRIDARRCLSYWTIEHRGNIPTHFWPYLADYWFGCDICQTVCPYNRENGMDHQNESVRKVNLPIRIETMDLYEVAMMDERTYERLFGGTPMTRAKREGLRRNAFIALCVKKDPRIPDLIAALKDDSSTVLRATVLQAREYLETSHSS